MKHFFDVKYADHSECYSGRFTVGNKYLDDEVTGDFSSDNHDLKQAIDLYVKKFMAEYDYWSGVADSDLNTKALKRKKKFMEFDYPYSILKGE